jgi:flagellar biosynthetic protein FliQ
VNPDAVLALGREAALTALAVGGPILGAVLLTGLVVSVVQAVTQVQEMTLTFIPKVIAVGLVLALLGHWMLGRLVGFSTSLLGGLAAYGR